MDPTGKRRGAEAGAKELTWCEVIARSPNPTFVTDAEFADRILATMLPWRVKHIQSGIVMLLVPPGKFVMGMSPNDPAGEDDERPAHEVTLTRAFYLGETPVTQAQWSQVNSANPSKFGAVSGNAIDRLLGSGLTNEEASEKLRRSDSGMLPVERVSWDDAIQFVRKTGLELPTEAQWEYACRAGVRTRRYGPLDLIAWHKGNANRQTQPVKMKRANALGFYDMLGNVFEWCSDYYGGAFYDDERSRSIDPAGPSRGAKRVLIGATNSNAGESRVLRGGSWECADKDCRASARKENFPEFGLPFIGFRVMKQA